MQLDLNPPKAQKSDSKLDNNFKSSFLTIIDEINPEPTHNSLYLFPSVRKNLPQTSIISSSYKNSKKKNCPAT